MRGRNPIPPGLGTIVAGEAGVYELLQNACWGSNPKLRGKTRQRSFPLPLRCSLRVLRTLLIVSVRSSFYPAGQVSRIQRPCGPCRSTGGAFGKAAQRALQRGLGANP